MKNVITALLLVGSAQALANEKKVTCSARLEGSIVKTVEANLNPTNSRIDFGEINGLMLSVYSDTTSSHVTLSMVDIQTMKYFGSHGSFGQNGEGLSLSISNNGKNTDLLCILRK